MNSLQLRTQDCFVDLLIEYVHTVFAITLTAEAAYSCLQTIEDIRVTDQTGSNKVPAVKYLRDVSKEFSRFLTVDFPSPLMYAPLLTAIRNCSRMQLSEDSSTMYLGRKFTLLQAKQFIDLYFKAMEVAGNT